MAAECTHGTYAEPGCVKNVVLLDVAAVRGTYSKAKESKEVAARYGQQDKMGFEDVHATHVGYMAEYGLSAMLGLGHWSPDFRPKHIGGPDLLGSLEVKGVEDERYSLILKPNDIALRCDYALCLVRRTESRVSPVEVRLIGWVDWPTVERYGIHQGDPGYKDRFPDRTWVRQDSGATFRTDCYRCRLDT